MNIALLLTVINGASTILQPALLALEERMAAGEVSPAQMAKVKSDLNHLRLRLDTVEDRPEWLIEPDPENPTIT